MGEGQDSESLRLKEEGNQRFKAGKLQVRLSSNSHLPLTRSSSSLSLDWPLGMTDYISARPRRSATELGFQEALDAYSQALKLKPSNAELRATLLKNRAAVLLKKTDFVAAERDCSKCER